jgi:hypothetical protein
VDLKSADRKRLWEFKSPAGRQDSIAYSSFSSSHCYSLFRRCMQRCMSIRTRSRLNGFLAIV